MRRADAHTNGSYHAVDSGDGSIRTVAVRRGRRSTSKGRSGPCRGPRPSGRTTPFAAPFEPCTRRPEDSPRETGGAHPRSEARWRCGSESVHRHGAPRRAGRSGGPSDRPRVARTRPWQTVSSPSTPTPPSRSRTWIVTMWFVTRSRTHPIAGRVPGTPSIPRQGGSPRRGTHRRTTSPSRGGRVPTPTVVRRGPSPSHPSRSTTGPSPPPTRRRPPRTAVRLHRPDRAAGSRSSTRHTPHRRRSRPWNGSVRRPAYRLASGDRDRGGASTTRRTCTAGRSRTERRGPRHPRRTCRRTRRIRGGSPECRRP